MTKHEIIDYIAGHYNLGNRAFNPNVIGNGCQYLTPDGKKCAFALMCTDEGLENIKFLESNAPILLSTFGDSILKDEFKGHDNYFYKSIQEFHDTEEYWTENGLSERGKRFVVRLKDRYYE